MDTKLEQDLADLEAVVDALPDYLTRSELYTSLPRTSEARLSLPVSIGLAQDRLKRLRQRPDLGPAVQARLAGLEARIEAMQRLYPDQFQHKLKSEERSRTYAARWQAEDDAEERDKRGKR